MVGYEIGIGGGKRVPLDQFIPNPPSPFVEFLVFGLLGDTAIQSSEGDEIPRGVLDLSRFDRTAGGVRVALGTFQGLEEGEPDALWRLGAPPSVVAYVSPSPAQVFSLPSAF